MYDSEIILIPGCIAFMLNIDLQHPKAIHHLHWQAASFILHLPSRKKARQQIFIQGLG